MARLSFPVGPQHPALKEPENLRFSVDGELVVEADIRIGYVHRSIERTCSERNYVQDLYLCERVCGICSNAHTLCYCMAVEQIAEVEIPERAQYIRMLMHEFERIHSHLLWLGVAGHEIGFDTLFMYVWRDREVMQDILETVSGSRGHYGMTILGGVRYDITPEMEEKIREGIEYLRERTEYYAKIATTETTFIKRTENVGGITGPLALDLGAVGPVLRASGVDYDVRRRFPYLKYDQVEFEVRMSEMADVLGRTLVRVHEIIDACNICEQVLDMMSEGEIQTRFPRRVPEGEAVARIEAQRGELIYYVRSDGTDVPERLKIRTPTLANLPAAQEMLVGGYVADIPITFASIDPCFSCTDRMVVLDDVSTSETTTMTWSELLELSRDR